MKFKITKGDYIELIQLLKALNLASSGAEAKILVEEGLINLNGETEYRKRAKVRTGDTVRFDEEDITVTIE